MKLFSTIAALCLSVSLMSCGTTQTADTTVAPGAIGVCTPDCISACCAAKAKSSADLGAVSDKAAGQCPFAAQKAAEGDTNFGAVSDKSRGCSSQCPLSGKKATSKNAAPSLGAVSDASGCSKAARSACCSATKNKKSDG